ncbi:molybdenum cofactor guanylyltransferase MobA [Methylomonas sp. LWB]|uniref:molybdenum cofactor guanylyltransferase MobA n=1 Tax=unclassified Methylomonas TaxID=2608980 RepID=UPI0008DA18A2|nr:molybdenum cofactor guanylyltransferase MobA [Methylomonas sp. LWB]OHX35053.1 molybdenum cofactor guanylyltransferase [Methylomonas sp. LWB]
MNGQNTVAGLVLAGGRARRMDGRDKGLLPFRGLPLAAYGLAALQPLVGATWISANRNRDAYRQLGYPVIADANTDFDGPLAGILAGMRACDSEILLILPCDTPLIETADLQRLLTALSDEPAIAAAHDGERWHPTVAALRTHLAADLQAYLDRGERKLQLWFAEHNPVLVDFSDRPGIFANVNTALDLAELDRHT